MFPHDAGQVGDCLSCHEPHGSVNPKQLKRANVYQLCIECHSPIGGGHARLTASVVPQPDAGAVPELHDVPCRDPRLEPIPAVAEVGEEKADENETSFNLVAFPGPACAAMGASAQPTTTPISLELGYRWVSVFGNEDMYKTQINEQQGLSASEPEPGQRRTSARTRGCSTTCRSTRATWAWGRAESVRLEAGKSEMYLFRLGYRNVDAYSALPAFANPLLSQGIIPGQHTYDRSHQMLDMNLDLLPGGKITPFVGYSWNKLDGPGTTTYHVGQDEFQLAQDLQDTETELRVGAGFNVGSFWGR